MQSLYDNDMKIVSEMNDRVHALFGEERKITYDPMHGHFNIKKTYGERRSRSAEPT